MEIDCLDSIILYVSALAESRKFYVDFLRLPVLFEDEIIVALAASSARIVLHRNDRGHDERGIFPAGDAVGGAAVRFQVADPDQSETEAQHAGVPVLWTAQDASWGRFVVLGDPDGRPVVLAKMRPRRES
jgi:catechol 2,3-dioxygenase-like lactoylglutathione lyase family enzyme